MSRACPPLPAEDLAHVLTHTGAHWEALRGKRLFITGGTGFFGMWLLESFAHANTTLNLGAEAVVLTRDPSAFARKAPHLSGRADLTFIAGDVRDFAFPPGVFSHVIHAGTTSGSPVSPEEMVTTIADGTRQVLTFACQSGAERLLYVSSGAVYGPQPPNLPNIHEDYIGEPTDAYGRGKKAAEQLCLDVWNNGGPSPVIARCFAFVGPHLPLDAHFAAGNFIRDALAGGPIRVAGDGAPYRSYLYAADLAVCLWTLLFAGKIGRAYNVGSDKPVSITELARATAVAIGDGCPVEIARPATSAVPAPRYVPATARLCSELDCAQRIGLTESLLRTRRWLAASRQ